MNLSDGGQGLSGLGVVGETVDERFQHVQCFDPAFLALKLCAYLEHRGLCGWIVAPAGEVQFDVRFNGAERASEFGLVGLGDPQ